MNKDAENAVDKMANAVEDLITRVNSTRADWRNLRGGAPSPAGPPTQRQTSQPGGNCLRMLAIRCLLSLIRKCSLTL